MAGWPKTDPEAKCYMPGIPRATYMPYPFQIVQGQKDILFVYEYASSNRIVHMSNHTGGAGGQLDGLVERQVGRRHARDRGHRLQRSVLVRPRRQPPQRGAEGHRALHAGRATTTSTTRRRIEDPKTFTRPWTIRMPLYRRVEPNVQLLEFKCVEFSEELLYGDLKKKTE